MTKDQLLQKTSRGTETYADLLARAMADDGQPAAMIAAQLGEVDEARQEETATFASEGHTACNPEAVDRAMADDSDNLDDVQIPRGNKR